MKVVITKLQYQKIVFNLLDVLYGPNISFKKDEDMFEILSDDGEEIFRLYTKDGRSKGCKKDLLVLSKAMEEFESYIPPTVLRKKLFSKTLLSYVNEKTNLNIDCIEFWYEKGPSHDKRYNFSVKKNKRVVRKNIKY